MSRLSTALLALLVASQAHAFCPDIFNNQTACSCYDYLDGAVIKCSGPKGPVLVEKLKTTHVEIRELTLENAGIVEIGPRAFKNLRIKKVVLDKNRITGMHKDAFRGLENVLVELSMQENALSEVPTEALSGLRALQVLNLRCNKIANLTSTVFKNNTALIDVNLACNKICKIDAGVFNTVRGSLQNLIFDNNCMEEFPAKAVEGMENLIALHLKYNKINKIGSKQLTNLTALSMLTLTGNNISLIAKDALQNTPNLRYLYLAENQLRGFETGTMAQFKQAQVVDLSFNEVTEISTETFAGLESLQHINLESNAIKEIAPGAFSGTPLLLLWLPNNCLSGVNANMFQGAPFLRQVSLANNNIRDVQPLSFAHLANLHTLDLAFNKIVSLQNGAITGSDHLTVRLQENPMVCGQDGFHVMNGGEAINLTTEANVICRGDWQADSVDLCPKQTPRPVPPPCCVQPTHAPKTTTTTLAPTTEVMKAEEKAEEQEEVEEVEENKEEPKGKKEEKKPSGEQKEEEEEEEEEYEEEEETTTAAAAPKKTRKMTTTPSTTTTEEPTTEEPSTIPGPKRKVNMERFWRLAQRPNANSPFMKHQARLGVNTSPRVLKAKDEASEEKMEERRVVTTTTPAPKAEEQDEGSEEEYEDDEEEETEAPPTTTARPTRRIPSRVANRKRMNSNLPPWLNSSPKAKPAASHQQPEIDFDKDDEAETVQVDQPAN